MQTLMQQRIELAFQDGMLRELEYRDVPTVNTLSSDRDVEQMFSPETPLTCNYWRRIIEEEARDRECEGYVRTSYSFVMEEHSLVKGVVRLNVYPYSFDFRKHLTEVSFFVGKEYRGRGLAVRALTRAIPFAFEDVGSGKVCAVSLKENTPAHRVLERVGLQKRWEGISMGRVRGRLIVMYDAYQTKYDSRLKQLANQNALKPSYAVA